MRNILITGDWGRADFIEQFKGLEVKYNLYFIEFNDRINDIPNLISNYGQVILWDNYKNCWELISEIKPEKIVFFDYEMFNQMALLITAKRKKIPTFFIEHGLRLSEGLHERIIIEKNRRRKLFRSVIRLPCFKRLFLLKNSFYKHTAHLSVKQDKNFLHDFFNFRLTHTISETYLHFGENLPIPDSFIIPCRKNLEFHKSRHEGLVQRAKYIEIGFPQFDDLANLGLKNRNVGWDKLILIDQPFVEQRLFGWTPRKKQQFLVELKRSIKDKEISVLVHPLSNLSIFKELGFRTIPFHELKKELKTTRIILGFSSTVLIPLACLDFSVVYTLEMHPNGIQEFPKFLIDSGVAEPVNNFEELIDSMEEINQVYENQLSRKKDFENKWMYKFDGMSKSRLKKVLL